MKQDELRAQLLAKREAMGAEEVRYLSRAIQDRLIKSPFWPDQGRVGLYAPVRNEVMTQTLFQEALEKGLFVYFPRVEQGIQFYEVNGPEDLVRGCWSIPEPKRDCPELSASRSLDLLVVPGIVFAKSGHRIGYGRGFYDQFIANSAQNTRTIGLAYEYQLAEGFPINEWDRQLSGIMTEKNFYPAETN